MMRVIWIMVRHRKVFVFRPGLRTNDMSVFVDAGVSGAGIEDPVAADLVVLLEDDDIKAELHCILCRGDATGTRPDYADLYLVSHDVPPLLALTELEGKEGRFSLLDRPTHGTKTCLLLSLTKGVQQCGIPEAALLDHSALGGKVDINHAEAFGIARAPLKIVHQRPNKVTRQRSP